MKWFRAGAGAFAAVVISASALTWSWSRSIDGRSGDPKITRSGLGVQYAFSEEIDRLLKASDEDDLFGIPIGTGNVGLVVDDRDFLGGHADQVARLVYAASKYSSSNGADFGVVEARRRVGGADDSESSPYYALPVLRIQAMMVPDNGEDVQSTRLSTALAMTARTSPDQVFVIVSEPLSVGEKEQVEAAIREVRVPVHMICLGNAADESCRALASISGGRFIPVSNQAIEDLVDRCNVEMPARSR